MLLVVVGAVPRAVEIREMPESWHMRAVRTVRVHSRILLGGVPAFIPGRACGDVRPPAPTSFTIRSDHTDMSHSVQKPRGRTALRTPAG